MFVCFLLWASTAMIMWSRPTFLIYQHYIDMGSLHFYINVYISGMTHFNTSDCCHPY